MCPKNGGITTPPGGAITVNATVTAIEGRKITWQVTAHDELELIGAGVIGRTVVSWQRFNTRVAQKTQNPRDASRRMINPTNLL